MQTDPFLHTARINKPYLVLLEPGSGRAAAYDGQHRLLTDHPSTALVAFALRRHVYCEAWDELSEPRLVEPPGWARADTMAGCTLYWLRDGWSKFRDLLETPDA